MLHFPENIIEFVFKLSPVHVSMALIRIQSLNFTIFEHDTVTLTIIEYVRSATFVRDFSVLFCHNI